MRAARILLLVAACGKSTPLRSDASEAAPDAPVAADADVARPDAVSPDASIDAPPELLIQVTMTVEIDGQRKAGERILINRRDGSLVGEGTTDSNGVFTVMMPDSGSLTWVRLDLPLKRYYTYMELHDGDVVNTGTPPPPPTGTVTAISITRTNIPGADATNFGVARFPDQMFTGTTFAYPTTATGIVAVIQDGRADFDEGGQIIEKSVGYSTAMVTVAPGAAITMPNAIHQAADLVVNVVAPVLEGGLITATVVPMRTASASTSYQEAANASGAVSIMFPRFVYSQVAYSSPLTVYFETVGGQYYEHHFTNYMIDSSVTQVNYGLTDLAECPGMVTFGPTTVTIGAPPTRGDFARYGIGGRWNIMVPFATTSFARIVVPTDLQTEFAGTQSPLMVGSVDSGDIDYREALSLQRSTHYSQYGLPSYPYTDDGHPYMRDCWRFQ
jgi:hypothetical protein